MATRPGDDGSDRWPERGLPGLPPDWGTIVVPNDAAELAEEAERIRAELRDARPLDLPRPASPRHGFPLDHGRPSLRTPLIIMTMAVLATIASLFAISWPGLRPRPRTPDTVVAGSALLPIALTDPTGAEVRIRELLPAVILLLDSCPCESLVSVTLNATVTDVTVIRIVPTLGDLGALPAGPAGRRLRLLLDRQDAVRGALPDLRQARRPAAVLVDKDASTVRIVPDITTSDQFLHDLHTFTR